METIQKCTFNTSDFRQTRFRTSSKPWHWMMKAGNENHQCLCQEEYLQHLTFRKMRSKKGALYFYPLNKFWLTNKLGIIKGKANFFGTFKWCPWLTLEQIQKKTPFSSLLSLPRTETQFHLELRKKTYISILKASQEISSKSEDGWRGQGFSNQIPKSLSSIKLKNLESQKTGKRIWWSIFNSIKARFQFILIDWKRDLSQSI